jgi:hypothetical protein
MVHNPFLILLGSDYIPASTYRVVLPILFTEWWLLSFRCYPCAPSSIIRCSCDCCPMGLSPVCTTHVGFAVAKTQCRSQANTRYNTIHEINCSRPNKKTAELAHKIARRPPTYESCTRSLTVMHLRNSSPKRHHSLRPLFSACTQRQRILLGQTTDSHMPTTLGSSELLDLDDPQTLVNRKRPLPQQQETPQLP